MLSVLRFLVSGVFYPKERHPVLKVVVVFFWNLSFESYVLYFSMSFTRTFLRAISPLLALVELFNVSRRKTLESCLGTLKEHKQPSLKTKSLVTVATI